MKYAVFTDNLEFHKTPKGVRIDLAIYLYADGHGNICNRTKDGKRVVYENDDVTAPFANPEEGTSMLRHVLEKGIEKNKVVPQMS